MMIDLSITHSNQPVHSLRVENVHTTVQYTIIDRFIIESTATTSIKNTENRVQVH